MKGEAGDRPASSGWGKAREILVFTLAIVGTLVAALVARRNWKLGRTDRKGALRVAGARMLLGLVVTAGAAHAVASGELLNIIIGAAEELLLPAGILWLVYLAIEPLVRAGLSALRDYVEPSVDGPLVGCTGGRRYPDRGRGGMRALDGGGDHRQRGNGLRGDRRQRLCGSGRAPDRHPRRGDHPCAVRSRHVDRLDHDHHGCAWEDDGRTRTRYDGHPKPCRRPWHSTTVPVTAPPTTTAPAAGRKRASTTCWSADP